MKGVNTSDKEKLQLAQSGELSIEMGTVSKAFCSRRKKKKPPSEAGTKQKLMYVI